ncbi:MAG: hypothetical protein Q8J78_15990 [Moraxellaceae bacterium]|nr:hypothetical protein [Moraxellaceae bacterium]
MLDDQVQFRLPELIPFIGAILTGAVGGSVACIQHARTRRETIATYAIAYLITGAFGGLMALAGAMVFYPEMIVGWSELLLLTGVAGLTTALALAAGNLSMRVVLRKLGLEVTINVQKSDPAGKAKSTRSEE